MSGLSRLSRAIQRNQLSGGNGRLDLGTPNVQPRPLQRTMQVGQEQLVPMLFQQGLVPECKIGRSPDGRVGVIALQLGPILIPMAFDAPTGRRIVDNLVATIEQITLANAAQPDPELEQLLADSLAAVGGPVEDDLTYSLDTQTEFFSYVPAAEACTDSPADDEDRGSIEPGRRLILA